MYPSLESLIGAGKIFAEVKIRLLREDLDLARKTSLPNSDLTKAELLAQAESVFRAAEQNLANGDYSSAMFAAECALMESEITRVCTNLGLDYAERFIKRYETVFVGSVPNAMVNSKSEKDFK